MAKTTHWGDWVVARSRFVGHRTQKELALDVGCRAEQVSRWVQMKTPPEQMRKGFDSSLARALKTTKQTLFVDWSAHAPDQTPQIMLIPDHALIPLGEDSHVLPAETMLAEVMARLMPDQVEKVLEFAITVGLSQNDRLRPEFERLRELYEAKVKERYALRARKSEIASSRRRAAT